MARDKIIFFLLSILMATADGQCTCGRNNDLRMGYPGSMVPCMECSRKFPVMMEIPIFKKTEYQPVHHEHKIDMPDDTSSTEIRYEFNFDVEQLAPKEDVKLQSYGYQIEVPSKQKDVRYVFDYQMEVPVTKMKPTRFEEVVAKPEKECELCRCRGLRPTLDMLRSCPKHGHLYRDMTPIVPIFYKPRYDNTEPKQDETLPRNKRHIPNFELMNRDLFNRDFFYKVLDNVEQNPLVRRFRSTTESLMQTFRPIIKTAVRSWFNSASDNDIFSTNHFVTKREANMGTEDDDSSAETSKCSTISSLQDSEDEKLRRAEVLQYMPEILQSNERTRKHCNSCGEPMEKHSSTSCQQNNRFQNQAEFFELAHGNPISYTPGGGPSHSFPLHDSKYVYDRLGHKYKIGNNGNLKLMTPQSYVDPILGDSNYAGEQKQEYGILRDIIARHPDFMHAINEQAGQGLIEPPVKIALDVMKFLRDAGLRGQTAHGKQQQHSDDEDVGAYQQYMMGDVNEMPLMDSNNPVKRSFQIVPLLKDSDDGSVLLKISPTKYPKKVQKMDYELFELAPNKVDKDMGQIKSKQQGTTSPLKTTKKAKEYEILTAGETGQTESEENIDIMRYIYESQARAQSSDESSTINADDQEIEINFSELY